MRNKTSILTILVLALSVFMGCVSTHAKRHSHNYVKAKKLKTGNKYGCKYSYRDNDGLWWYYVMSSTQQHNTTIFTASSTARGNWMSSKQPPEETEVDETIDEVILNPEDGVPTEVTEAEIEAEAAMDVEADATASDDGMAESGDSGASDSGGGDSGGGDGGGSD